MAGCSAAVGRSALSRPFASSTRAPGPRCQSNPRAFADPGNARTAGPSSRTIGISGQQRSNARHRRTQTSSGTVWHINTSPNSCSSISLNASSGRALITSAPVNRSTLCRVSRRLASRPTESIFAISIPSFFLVHPPTNHRGRLYGSAHSDDFPLLLPTSCTPT